MSIDYVHNQHRDGRDGKCVGGCGWGWGGGGGDRRGCMPTVNILKWRGHKLGTQVTQTRD